MFIYMLYACRAKKCTFVRFPCSKLFQNVNNSGFAIVIFNGTHPKMKIYEVKYHHTKFGAFITK